MVLDVFISYSSKDRERVLEIEKCLNGVGISTWLDRTFIDGGDNYGASISNGIRNCKALLLICSAASMRSRNVQHEIMLAWKYEKPYLPLLIDEYLLTINGFPEQVEYWLEGSQWIEIYHDPCQIWRTKVMKSLQKVDAVPSSLSNISDASVPDPVFPHQNMEGLLSISRYTDKIWPVPAERASRALTRSGTRDLGAPQDEVSHVFRRGDRVSIIIESDKEGYLTLFDIGTTGKIYSLCPSQFAPDVNIHIGKNEYPQQGAEYPSFAVTGYPGREQILALISQKPLELNLMPDTPKVPAKILSPAEIKDIINQLHHRDSAEWMAFSTYFDVT